MKTTLCVAVLALALAGNAFGASFSARTLSDAHVGKSKKELIAQRNYSKSQINALRHSWLVAPRHATCWSHVPWSKTCDRARHKLFAHRWLYKLAQARYTALYAPVAPSGAMAWYNDGATQCEVDHEGGWTSVSPNGMYAGRFQSDSNFETSTPFGRLMEARYGRAYNWPSWAQIQHAYEVWQTRGWSPWPPYYKYGCAAYHGRSYT